MSLESLGSDELGWSRRSEKLDLRWWKTPEQRTLQFKLWLLFSSQISLTAFAGGLIFWLNQWKDSSGLLPGHQDLRDGQNSGGDRKILLGNSFSNFTLRGNTTKRQPGTPVQENAPLTEQIVSKRSLRRAFFDNTIQLMRLSYLECCLKWEGRESSCSSKSWTRWKRVLLKKEAFELGFKMALNYRTLSHTHTHALTPTPTLTHSLTPTPTRTSHHSFTHACAHTHNFWLTAKA